MRFIDRMAEGNAFSKMGVLPVNHALHGARETSIKSTWVAFNLIAALSSQKHISMQNWPPPFRRRSSSPKNILDDSEIFGQRSLPLRCQGQSKMLETLIDFSHEQGLITKKPKIEELFAESTLGL